MSNPYKILYILLFVSTISYIFFRIYLRRKRNLPLENLRKADRFREVEIALLGDDFLDKRLNNSPFNNEKKTVIYQFPLELIVDGNINEENLNYIHKDSGWLIKTINKKGFNNIQDVTYAVIDSSGRVHVM